MRMILKILQLVRLTAFVLTLTYAFAFAFASHSSSSSSSFSLPSSSSHELPPTYNGTDRFLSIKGVDTSSSPLSSSCTHFENPCATLSFVLSVSEDGDVIHVGAGDFVISESPSAVFVSVNVAIVGDTPTDTDDDGEGEAGDICDLLPSVLDGNHSHSNLLYITSSGSFLSHLFFTGSTASVLVYDFETQSQAGEHFIQYSCFRDNGDGVGVVGADIHISNSHFQHNKLGALHLSHIANASVSDCSFSENNNAPYVTDTCGTAISMIRSNVTLQHIQFDGHTPPSSQSRPSSSSSSCSIVYYNGNLEYGDAFNSLFMSDIQFVNNSLFPYFTLIGTNNAEVQQFTNALPDPENEHDVVNFHDIANNHLSSHNDDNTSPSLFVLVESIVTLNNSTIELSNLTSPDSPLSSFVSLTSSTLTLTQVIGLMSSSSSSPFIVPTFYCNNNVTLTMAATTQSAGSTNQNHVWVDSITKCNDDLICDATCQLFVNGQRLC